MCGRSSIEVLLSWLAVTTPAGNINFVRWKGGLRTKDGVNKKTVAKEISDLLMTRHRLVRNVASIMAKLSELQTTFNAARDFLNHTGSGILDTLREQCDEDSPEYQSQVRTIHVRFIDRDTFVYILSTAT
jgi:hypothetical protein